MGWFQTCLTVYLLRIRTFFRRWQLVFRRPPMRGSPYRDDPETRAQAERIEREYLESVCSVQRQALKGGSIRRLADRSFGFVCATTLFAFMASVSSQPGIDPSHPTNHSSETARFQTMDAGVTLPDRRLDGGFLAGGTTCPRPPETVWVMIGPVIIDRIGNSYTPRAREPFRRPLMCLEAAPWLDTPPPFGTLDLADPFPCPRFAVHR